MTMLGFAPSRLDDPRELAQVELSASRVEAPDALAEVISASPEDRIRHTYGRAYPDVLRGFRGDFASAPDLVARPRT